LEQANRYIVYATHVAYHAYKLNYCYLYNVLIINIIKGIVSIFLQLLVLFSVMCKDHGYILCSLLPCIYCNTRWIGETTIPKHLAPQDGRNNPIGQASDSEVT